MVDLNGVVTYRDLSDEEIHAAVREIVKTSRNENQVYRRIKNELRYPFRLAVQPFAVVDQLEVLGNKIPVGLGGLITKCGPTTLVLIYGHREVISVKH